MYGPDARQVWTDQPPTPSDVSEWLREQRKGWPSRPYPERATINEVTKWAREQGLKKNQILGELLDGTITFPYYGCKSDLKLLVDVIDGGDTHPNFGDLLLLSAMLALGEGLEPGDIATMQKRTNQFFIMVFNIYCNLKSK